MKKVLDICKFSNSIVSSEESIGAETVQMVMLFQVIREKIFSKMASIAKPVLTANNLHLLLGNSLQ